MPQLPASVFRIGLNGYNPGEGRSIRRKTPRKAALEYSIQETHKAQDRRDRHLRGRVPVIFVIPALSHHRASPIAGFQHSDLSTRQFLIVGCVLSPSNTQSKDNKIAVALFLSLAPAHVRPPLWPA
jgi:hypothetical protein